MRRRIAGLFRGNGRRALLLVGVALALFHALAWSVAEWVAQASVEAPAQVDLAATATLLFVFPWIVSQALTNATRALYSRGDLDLVLASPASPRAAFAARALAIAVESVVSVAIFLAPLANMLAIAAGPRWLGVYPTLAACGLAGAGVGLALTMLLFRVAGPRRTRVLAQVFATLIGAAFAFGVQAANLLPASIQSMLLSRFDGAAARGDAAQGALAIPVHAAAGDPLSIAVVLAAGAGVFALACVGLGAAFSRGVVSAAEAPAQVRRGAREAAAFRAGSGAALRRKEWRLLARDPWLASQMLLQVSYTLPLCFVLWRTLGPDQGAMAAVAPAVVIVAAQLAGALAWVTLSTEDAPEFLLTAPVSRGAVERAKMSAVAIPLGVVIALPLACMAVGAPAMAAATLVFAAGGAASTILLNLWHPAPGRRGDVMRRHNQSKLVGILEHLLAMFWAVAVALFAAGSAWFAAPVALALAALALNRPVRSS